MKKPGWVLAATILPLCSLTPASHAGEGRAYLGGQAGMFLPLESDVTTKPADLQGRLTYNPGVVLAATGGYEFGNGVRCEGELNFRRVTTDRLYSDHAPVQVDAALRSWGAMANAYYDIRTPSAVTPFLGAGIGLVVANIGKGTSQGSTLWNSGRDSSLAYQGIAGFSVALNDQTFLDFAYHHYGSPSLHFGTLNSQYKGLNLSTGLRYRF